MFNKILIPLDRSELAEKALHYLPAMAVKEQTELVLMAAITPQMYSFGLGVDDPDLVKRMMGHTEEKFQKYLTDVEKRLSDDGYTSSIQIVYGDAAQSIVDVANEAECDLIAMTTHGYTGLSRWMLGSVADRVLHTAKQPVFLARAALEMAAPFTVGRILLPLDGSQPAKQVLNVTKGMATHNDATITMLHVLANLSSWEKQLLLDNQLLEDSVENERITAVKEYLSKVGDGFAESNISCDAEIVSGTPASVILERAEADEIDLVVMASHGRTGQALWAFGSVATKVLNGAKCPLLMIRGIQKVKVE